MLLSAFILSACGEEKNSEGEGCEEWDEFVDPAPFVSDDSKSAYETAAPSGQTLAEFVGTDDEVAAQCEDCHSSVTPAEVLRYHDSEHAALDEPIDCVQCHGRDGHGEYLAFGYTFASETLGIDGKTTIGSGREHTYWEWKPKMIVKAMQSCQNGACHAANYEAHVGVDRVTEGVESAVTPFHGMLRFDHGISSWNDTMMSSFGIALWETYGTDVFRENCVRCHNQVEAFNVVGKTPDTMTEDDPFLLEMLEEQAKDIPAFAGNKFPGVFRESLLLSRCVECHTRHDFSRASAREPSACAKCHSGPDHPQIEAYETSKHGWAFEHLGAYSPVDNPTGAPTCSTCHFTNDDTRPATARGPAMNHDLTQGLAWNYTEGSDEWKEHREKMLGQCSTCHAKTHAEINLFSADNVARDATSTLMGEIIALCNAAYDRGIIEPAENPFFDDQIQFLPTFFHAIPWATGKYRVSKIELLCWNAWRERAVVSQETGAWHFSPQFTHWLGLKPADEFIGEIRELLEFHNEGLCGPTE